VGTALRTINALLADREKIRAEYSKRIWWVCEHNYQLERWADIITVTSGCKIQGAGVYRPEGVMLFQIHARFQGDPEKYVRIYTAHGTSNKMQKPFWMIPRDDHYDYFFVSGPKMRWGFEKWGHDLKRRELRIGNEATDRWIRGVWSVIAAKEEMKIRDDRPICLYTPTWKTGALTAAIGQLKLLTEQYHVVIKTHPMEPVPAQVKKAAPWAKWYEGSTLDILFAADLLISDESSLLYDFAITGRPIIIQQNNRDRAFRDHWDLKDVTAVWKPEPPFNESILTCLGEAWDRKEKCRQLALDAFYFNDGKAAERGINYILNFCDMLKSKIKRKEKSTIKTVGIRT
jgi:CDP-glycerol glycerophosphotransferase (TagB/SpsB family)